MTKSDIAITTRACPFCQSEQVSTTSKAFPDASYWRCHACGEIWNPSRLIVMRPQLRPW
jgi:transposase-like protein